MAFDLWSKEARHRMRPLRYLKESLNAPLMSASWRQGNGRFFGSTGRNSLPFGQLELPIERPTFRDRNADRGGRSFYFFDFDDNVAFLTTPAFVFHKETGRELRLSSGEFARHSRHIGKQGPYRDYQMDLCARNGTFRCFRDQHISVLERLLFGRRQMFVEDLAAALGQANFEWRGPSWAQFYHATLNRRPLSLITARGHHPNTIREGIRLFVQEQHLPFEPNYLTIFPVSNPEVCTQLGDPDQQASVATRKGAAIRASVERAIQIYGANPFHRFGMSDDDPANIELIVREMTQLKIRFPEMSFFVIETQQGRFVKWEVYPDRTEAMVCARSSQDFGVFEQLPLLSNN